MTEFPKYIETRLMTDDHLDNELKKATDRVSELKKEWVKRSLYSEEIKLAHKLHAALCQSRDCDWYYQKWDEPIMSNISEPRRYLNIAGSLIQRFTAEDIAALIAILKK